MQVGNKNSRLTIHFSRDFASHLKPPGLFGKVLVDSIEDITANKIYAALGRCEIKNLVDLYFLSKDGYTIKDYFESAQQKDAGLSYETLAYSLNQFEIFETPAFMVKPVAVHELKNYLESTITWLIEQSAPSN